MSEWQPIDSAPKDDEILLCGPESVDIGSWQDGQPDLKESGTIVEPGSEEGWYGCRGMWPGGEQPTHWMPVPEPPAETPRRPQR